MQPHQLFGRTGREIPILGQGTYDIGQHGAAKAVEALRRGLDAGMTHIDTAELYNDGKAETLVGEAIAGRRDEVFLVSKVLPQHASYEGVAAACEASLRRLRTDRLDCYLLHWREDHPLADTFAGFEALERAGKILSWGVSNFDVADLEEALAIAGPGRIACNQIYYHLGDRGMEHAVLPWCEAHGVAVVGYKPFGLEAFPSPASAGGQVLAEIAADHGVTPRQVALAALSRRAWIVVKASDPDHVVANAAAGALSLSDQEIAQIEAAFPLDPRPRLPRPF
jgi:diketogulonate reductase-like aldo/keto reductase